MKFGFLIFTIVFCSITSSFANDLEKPVVHFEAWNMLDSNGSLKPESVELIKKISASDKFEILISGGNQADIIAQLDQLRTTLGGEEKLVYWWDRSSPLRNNLSSNQINNYNYVSVASRSFENNRDIYADLIHTYHNYLNTQQSLNYTILDASWSNEYKDFLYELGPDAFNPIYADEIATLEWVQTAPVREAPVQCRGGFGEGESRVERFIDVNICKKRLGFNYRWINEAEKICGEYTNNNLFIQESLYLNCEPEHVQNFENYISGSVNPLCRDMRVCLNEVTGQELTDLTGNILDLLTEMNISQLRSQNYNNQSFDYITGLSGQLEEMRSLYSECERVKAEQALQNKLANDPEFREDYEKAIAEYDNAFAKAFENHQDMDENVELWLQEAKNDYNQCILKKLQTEEGSRGQYLYEDCIRDSYFVFLDKYRNHHVDQFPGENKTDFANRLEAETSFCSPSEYSSYDQNITSFDLNYDLNSCVERIDQMASDLNATVPMSDQLSREIILTASLNETQKSEMLNDFNERVREDIRGCRDIRASRVEACQREVYVRNTYEAYLDQLQERNSDVREKIGESLVLRNRVIEDLLGADEVRDCFERVNQEQEQASSCEEYVVTAVANLRDSRFLWNNTEGLAAEAMAEDFQLYTRTLSRDISTFHYGNDIPTNIPFGQSAYAQARQFVFHVGPRLNNMIGVDGATMMGRGLYTATDPNATMQYGDTVLEVPLSEGENYLDLREFYNSFPISYETYQRLMDNGCNLDNYRKGIYGEVQETTPLTESEYYEQSNELRTEYYEKVSVIVAEYEERYAAAGDDQEAYARVEEWYRDARQEIDTDYYNKSRRLDSLYYNNGVIGDVDVDTDRNNIEINIHDDRSAGGVYATVSKGVFEVFAECHEPFSQALKAQGINFLAYSYSSYLPPYCSRGNAYSPAFVMINTSFWGSQAITMEEVEEAIRKHNEEDEPYPPHILRYLQASYGARTEFDNALTDEERFTGEAVSHWKERLFNCDPNNEEDTYRQVMENSY